MRRAWVLGLVLGLAGQEPSRTGLGTVGEAVVERAGPLRKVQALLRENKTAEARRELQPLLASQGATAYYQLARTYLLDFYREQDAAKRRVSLGLAMEALSTTIERDAKYIPALRAKAVIHARAELLFYDPNLAYQLAARVAELEPHAHEYLLSLSDWLSGEVRFTHEGGHRVPHDPLLGLDRAVELLDRVVDEAMPFSNEEAAAYFQLGKALSRRGNFREAVVPFERALERAGAAEQKREVLRELGAAYYRMDRFEDAAKHFYDAAQLGRAAVDRWLLRSALNQMAARPPLPEWARFETAAGDSGGLRLHDIARERGVDRLSGNGTSAWGDFDQDGDLDLFESGSGTFLAVYRNDGGKFREVTAEVGLKGVPSGYSLNAVDYDNDGWLDLYVALNGWSGPLKNRLFRNVRGKFEDVSAKSGADDAGDGFVSLWGDLDNDGLLDLVVANGVLKDGSVTQIYRNRGDGTFENVTRQAGLNEPAEYGAIGIALGDYDKDGDLDLLINGSDAAPNRLYRNEGDWKFVDVARQAGILQGPHNGFVCFFADFDNDAWPDILTTSLAPWDAVVEGLLPGYPARVHPDSTRLFRNNGDGTFRDVTVTAGLHLPAGTMGAGVADVDNDGFVDLYLGTGDPQMTRLEPNRLFRNVGGRFADVTFALGMARPGNKGHGVTFVDLDGDGDLEIYAQLGGHYPGDWARNALYENRTAKGARWIALELRGTRSNRFGVGAKVTVRGGGKLFYREVKGGEGFGATDPYRVHIGLGKLEQVDEIEVQWPSGLRQSLPQPALDQGLTVTEPAL